MRRHTGRGHGGLLLAAALMTGLGGCALRGPGVPPEADVVLRPPPVAPGLPSLAQDADRLARRLSTVEVALAANALERAEQSLTALIGDVDQVTADLPGRPLVRAVDEAAMALEADAPEAAPALETLLQQVQAREAALDPGVVEAVRRAAQLAEQGERAQAAGALAEARRQLVEDLGAFPLDEVYARLLEAQELLQRGAVGRARVVLGGAAPLVAEVRQAAALVPVRWAFRAAAIATERGEPEVAASYLGDAVERLETMNEPQHAPLMPEVEALEADARVILQELQRQTRAPFGALQRTAGALRSLAERTLLAVQG